MPRASKTNKKNPPARSTTRKTIRASKPRKVRVGNVRGLILNALKAGGTTRPALQKKTRVSYNALVIRLSELKAEGIVVFDSSNRIVSLANSAALSVVAPKVPKATLEKRTSPDATGETFGLPAVIENSTVLAPIGYAAQPLKSALDDFSSRVQPIQGLDEKLLVLDQLASQIGGPIAAVLTDIQSDLRHRATA